MTDHSRRSADEPGDPGVLEMLGFSAPAAPPAPRPGPLESELPPHARAPIEVPAVASSRREARALEARPSRTSPERRIRKVQKSYAKKPVGRRTAVVPVASSSSRRPVSRARTIGSRILSVAAMIFAGALAVGMSVPANAFGTLPSIGSDLLTATTTTQADKAVAGQTLDVAADAAGADAARDEYTVTSWAEMLRLQYGTRDYSYEMGDPNGPIRWPFPYPVPISSGFGERNAPCRGCSSMHMGLDFTPGEGAPIYAMATGTVVESKDDAYGYGNHVIIDHGNLLGNGTNIKSLYAHMQHGSTALRVGDTIEVGDFIGTVGMTGTATGNHLHFEVHVNDAQVDPFAWLQTNTK
ncbi:MAG TPA: M23 family metallopeptidase [Pseudolysinimonas sp.]|nr:M23 family metallopeptidase [Pseudolysinimonas sp.]